MLVVMDMSTGRIMERSPACAEESARRYTDEVLHAEWVAVPRLACVSEEPAPGRSGEPLFDSRGFMATLYAAQE